MTRPLRSTGITPLHHYYEAVRPSPAHRYFQPRGWSRLCFFPWHRRPGSPVPYKSQIELRAAYTPDAAWAVSVHPPSLSRKVGQPPVLTSPTQKLKSGRWRKADVVSKVLDAIRELGGDAGLIAFDKK